ncbi:MAG: 50S ribosomal protein L11 methyltransferase, partial [Pseudomonadota bacterium]
ARRPSGDAGALSGSRLDFFGRIARGYAAMMSPDTPLYVYEIAGSIRDRLNATPRSFVGLWNEDDVSYVFFTEALDDYVNNCLSGSDCALRAKHLTLYSEWVDAMPAGGVSIGDLLFVADDHPSPPPEAILLDPSVAFGDGSHPTTAACLQFMHELIPGKSVKSMLDLGTGMGILSVAAAALGVTRITAVDRNVLAARAAVKNVELNRLGSTITVIEGDAREFIDHSYELAVANLPFEVIESIAELDATAGVQLWVISGISDSQGEIVEELFSRKGFRQELFRRDFPWVSFAMIRS